MPTPALCKNCSHAVAQKLDLCRDCYEHSVVAQNAKGEDFIWYCPQLHQRPYHESNSPNLLALGTRGTGKSKMMRMDAIIRCMRFPGFKVLILRRTIPDLRKSHLRFINAEMKSLGGGTDRVGYFRQTTSDVIFANGSFIQFSHCETIKDVENYLGSEWDLIIFDELSTFTLEMFLQISAAARATEEAPWVALVRAGSNPLGPGAAWMKQWFIDKNVDLVDYPDYLPDDFEMQFSTLDDNRYVNRKDYEKRLRNLPEHIRRAWLRGEFVIEGAYFTDFKRTDNDGKPWHVVKAMPTWKGQYLGDLGWINFYRALDWGYFPDPAVCLWIAVLPNGLEFVVKERKWRRTLAADVAKEIKRESEGLHIVDSFCDPTMFVKDGAAPFSIGEIFEQNGVPLTPAQNDRELYGYAIHEHLNTLIDERPKLQLVEHACPDLVRTIPLMQMDKNDARKLADGEDHWVVALAYFCMGQAVPSRDPVQPTTKRWMQPKTHRRAA